jgi:uncharacterized membrane protein YqgA involved in biofilm formation
MLSMGAPAAAAALASGTTAFRGAGTVVNVIAIVLGSGIGLLLGNRLPARVRDVVTDGLGLVVLLVAGLSAVEVTSPELRAAVGRGWPVLIVLGAIVLGGITGSVFKLESRLEGLGAWLRRITARRASSADGTARFIEGFVTASLVFLVGPLAILGSISDGLGHGIDQLALKSALDFFAAMAFAASLGVGVMFSAISVGIYQALFTLLGWALGDVLNAAQIAALTATGGLLLCGVALRLLKIRQVPVADMIPALLFAPLLVAAVVALQ